MQHNEETIVLTLEQNFSICKFISGSDVETEVCRFCERDRGSPDFEFGAAKIAECNDEGR